MANFRMPPLFDVVAEGNLIVISGQCLMSK